MRRTGRVLMEGYGERRAKGPIGLQVSHHEGQNGEYVVWMQNRRVVEESSSRDNSRCGVSCACLSGSLLSGHSRSFDFPPPSPPGSPVFHSGSTLTYLASKAPFPAPSSSVPELPRAPHSSPQLPTASARCRLTHPAPPSIRLAYGLPHIFLAVAPKMTVT